MTNVGNQGKVNRYSCDECGGVIVTVDRDAGVTPYIVRGIPHRMRHLSIASVGAQPSICEGRMTSAIFNCDQRAEPSHHWVRMTEDYARSRDRLRWHREGGLFCIPIAA